MQEAIELADRIWVSLAGAFAEHYVALVLADFALLHPKPQIELNFNSSWINQQLTQLTIKPAQSWLQETYGPFSKSTV